MNNRTKLFIFGIFIICILFFGFFLVDNNKSLINPTEEQIKEFNDIVSSPSSKDDIKKCDDIGNEDLEISCKAQLKNKFSPLFQADNISICFSDKDQLKQDMCILDLAYNKAKSVSETGLCNEIKNQDIKDACFAQVMNKKF